MLHCEFFLPLSPVFWNTRTKEHKILELKSVIVCSSLALWLKIPCNWPIKIKNKTPFLKSSITSFTTIFMLTSCSFTKFCRFDVTYSNLSGVDSIKVSKPSFLSISLKESKIVCHLVFWNLIKLTWLLLEWIRIMALSDTLSLWRQHPIFLEAKAWFYLL